jgi:hypothetical protein
MLNVFQMFKMFADNSAKIGHCSSRCVQYFTISSELWDISNFSRSLFEVVLFPESFRKQFKHLKIVLHMQDKDYGSVGMALSHAARALAATHFDFSPFLRRVVPSFFEPYPRPRGRALASALSPSLFSCSQRV